MAAIETLIRRVRRRAKDNPVRILIQNNPLAAAGAAITLRSTDVGYFKSAGVQCCFDDETDELVITSAAADTAAFTIAVDRGQDGTTAAEHLQNTALLVRPRFSNAEILDRLTYIVESELWPQVWLFGEAKVAYQGSNEYYDPDVPDIEEVSYVYQLSGGARYSLGFDFLSRSLADDVNFPNGALTIHGEVDSSNIYFAYRARPSLGTLSGELESLAVMGPLADLLMAEEAASAGGDQPTTAQRVQPGTRLRAGAVLWDRFTGARTQHRIALQDEEQHRRRRLSGVRYGS